MSVDLLTTEDYEAWWGFLKRMPQSQQHIHYTPDYHRVLEDNGDGDALLFVYSEDSNLFFYPFMLREINRVGDRKVDLNYHDVSSVFGYTGPLIQSYSKEFIRKSQNAIQDLFKQQNVISELIRYNPILQNNDYSAPGLSNIPVKEYVYIDLPADGTELLNIYSKRMQTYLNKAERQSIDIAITTSKGMVYDFFDLYCQHMVEIDVDKYYLFSDSYFASLYRLIKNFGYLICSKVNGEMVAGLIFLAHGDTAYYHHGARNTDVNNSGLVNKYLFHRAFIKQVDDNISNCLLGGGATDAADDSLLQFKKFFTNRSTNFVIGRRIIDRDKYNKIIQIWREECPDVSSKYENYVDKYRFC